MLHILLTKAPFFGLSVIFYFLGLAALIDSFWGNKIKDNFPHLRYLLICTAWPISIFARGFIASWGYYLDFPIETMFWSSIGAGFLFAWLTRRDIYRMLTSLYDQVRTTSKAPQLLDVLLLCLLGFLFLTYSSQIWIQWRDHDEIAVYGYMSKLIATGIGYDQLIFKGGVHDAPLFAQALGAHSYFAIENTYLIRLHRWLALFFSSLSVFLFLRLFNVRRWIALLTAANVLAIPELREYMGISMKTDVPVMLFELHAYLLLIVALAKNSLPFKVRRNIVTFGVILASASFASRASGLYILAISGLIWLWHLYQETKEGRSIRSFWREGTIIIICLLSINHLWIHLIEFGNPLFPVKAPWPFNDAPSAYSIADYRGYYNLQGVNPILAPFYMIFHLAFGLERFPDIAWGHASHRTVSMGWLSPLLLSLFALPLFFAAGRKKTAHYKVVAVTSLIFIIAYAFWFSGVHYSRVFFAASCLPILLTGLIADEKGSPNRLLNKLSSLAIFALVVSALYFGVVRQFRWKNFLPLREPPTSQLQSLGERDFPSPQSIQEMADVLSQAGLFARVHSYSGRNLHVLFRFAVFAEAPHIAQHPKDFPGYGNFPLIIVNRRYAQEKDPLSLEAIPQQFPYTCVEDGNWSMRSREPCPEE